MVETKRAELADLAHATFDVSRHEQLLVDLWSLAFPSELYERSSERWSEIGFQGRDPTSDLRGAGLLSLRHLRSFVETVGMSFVREQNRNGFPVALASFSCTAMLCRYFQLNESIAFPGASEHRATCDVQTQFLRLAQQTGADLLQQMHSRLLQRLASTWAETQTPTTTIMDFPPVLRVTYSHLHRALSATPRPWQLSGVVDALQRDSTTSQAPGWAWSALAPGACHSVALMLLWMLFIPAHCSRTG